MGNFLFTSESVGEGHPDKIADQIADAIVDASLKADPDSKVACNVLVNNGIILIIGKVNTKANVDFKAIAEHTIESIGYDYHSCKISVLLDKQTPAAKKVKEEGAQDQGLMFGYASDETAELMPMPINSAHKIVRELKRLRQSNELIYLGPDSKAQVTIEYNERHIPIRLDTVVISTQHNETVSQETLEKEMKALVYRVISNELIDANTHFYINRSGPFITGGVMGNCGLTGRKIIVDTYGGMGRHGGGAFSGKDPSKIDRSGAYAARYVAKNIVAARLAKRCEIQISYAIGMAKPIGIKVDTFGTGKVSEETLAKGIFQIFTLSPEGIIEMLNLKRPIYLQTAFGGHFGNNKLDLPWEKIDKVKELINACK